MPRPPARPPCLPKSKLSTTNKRFITRRRGWERRPVVHEDMRQIQHHNSHILCLLITGRIGFSLKKHCKHSVAQKYRSLLFTRPWYMKHECVCDCENVGDAKTDAVRATKHIRTPDWSVITHSQQHHWLFNNLAGRASSSINCVKVAKKWRNKDFDLMRVLSEEDV